jgi:hypothetical protein
VESVLRFVVACAVSLPRCRRWTPFDQADVADLEEDMAGAAQEELMALDISAVLDQEANENHTVK